MKEFIELVWEATQSLVMKMISFKNIVFAVATYVGMRMAGILNANFKEWAVYQLVLLVLFYTSNQFQKWLFAKALEKKAISSSTTTTETFGGNEETEQ